METIELFFPSGPAWQVDPNSQLADVRAAINNEILTDILDRAGDSGTVRDPFRCVDYTALAEEYGVELFSSWGGDLESYRRYLSTFVYTPYRTGSDTDMQTVLNDAGFSDLVVVKNNYVQDPRPFQGDDYNMVCAGDNAYCGLEDAYCGITGYEVLANGPLKDDNGNSVGYPIGDDPDYWGYVDFICGSVTYNPDGSIQSMSPAVVSDTLELSLKRLLLRTKPLHCWLILLVDFEPLGTITQFGAEIPNTITQDGEPTTDTITETGK